MNMVVYWYGHTIDILRMRGNHVSASFHKKSSPGTSRFFSNDFQQTLLFLCKI